MASTFPDFPISPYLDNLSGTLAREGKLLLGAETGAGKTTLLPWALLLHAAFASQKIILLEPRRLAARAAAERIASLLGESLGQRVGLRTRVETRISRRTRLEVVTEGVLIRLLQADPSLAGYGTLLFDEFHIRSLQGDLALALACDARKIFRPDLRLAILSATLPGNEIQAVLGDWPLIQIPGRAYPVDVHYRPPLSPRETPWAAASRLLPEALAAAREGTVLCFLPGYREMHRAQEALLDQNPAWQNHVFLLHGQMPPDRQQAVLDPASQTRGRIILATNVAETSLTIPGVTVVVDLGLERRVRFSPRTGMDHWETLPISQASAEQRRGRAGRTQPGQCYRWWHPDDRREAFAPPGIVDSDLAPLVLETALWGAAAPLDLCWLTPPPTAALTRASALLTDLGLLDREGKITPDGRRAAHCPVHPRLARMILSAAQTPLAQTAITLAVLLENDDLLAGQTGNDPDLRNWIAAFWELSQTGSSRIPAGAGQRLRDEIRRIQQTLGQTPLASVPQTCDPQSIGPVLLTAFPDRVAKRTRLDDPQTSRWRLATGRGAWLKGPLSRETHIVAPDVEGGDPDARIWLAAPVSVRDITTTLSSQVQENWIWEWKDWRPVARRALTLAALVLKETRAGLPPEETLQNAALSRLQDQGLAGLPWDERSIAFLARCRFVAAWGNQPDWPALDEVQLLTTARGWLLPFGRWNGETVWDADALLTALENYLGWTRRQTLAALAPERLALPSGATRALDYLSGEVPKISGRVQEFFGCSTTPTLCGQPLMLDLLSPAGRTVQLTRDLDGFWDRAYPAVKKELQGRYPRHAWPDDPRAAQATSRAKPRRHEPQD